MYENSDDRLLVAERVLHGNMVVSDTRSLHATISVPTVSILFDKYERVRTYVCAISSGLVLACMCKMIFFLNPRPDRGVGVTPPLRFFADSEKKRRRVAPPGFGVPYGANLAQLLVKKMTRSGQVTEL